MVLPSGYSTGAINFLIFKIGLKVQTLVRQSLDRNVSLVYTNYQ